MEYLSHGESGSSFKEISDATGINPTALAYHLKQLVKAGLIRKEFRNMEGTREYSFYSSTGKGRIIHNMIEAAYRRESLLESSSGKLPKYDRLIILPSRIGPRCFSIYQEEEGR